MVGRTYLLGVTVVSALASAATGLATNVASDLVPSSVKGHPVGVWVVFALLVLITVGCAVTLAKDVRNSDGQKTGDTYISLDVIGSAQGPGAHSHTNIGGVNKGVSPELPEVPPSKQVGER